MVVLVKPVNHAATCQGLPKHSQPACAFGASSGQPRLVSLILNPFFHGLFLWTLSLIGPVISLFIVGSIVQYRVFAPITGQQPGWKHVCVMHVLTGFVNMPVGEYTSQDIWRD